EGGSAGAEGHRHARREARQCGPRLALGGIRLPEIAVPVARESAELCGLGGTHVPLDAATLNALYPTHADYVAKVTRATQDAVKAGFLLPADAAQTIDKARRSIYGAQLTCGPLCADVRQFPGNPSSMLLANQTAYLVIKDGDRLVKMVDEATRAIAEGYTLGADPRARQKFTAAAARLDAYITAVHACRTRGDVPVETETLLVDQATTLTERVRALAGSPSRTDRTTPRVTSRESSRPPSNR
ncbi:MAG TPA: alpha/beta hydrolase domain-containing protein, partial [Vicinamibacterales bacterium]|nr:alpha/beta hydrolase domain-containing protein [Vicinamibacterales bacterium]